MASTGLPANPVWWVQFRLSGGWRNAVALCVGYCGLVGVIAIFTFQGRLGVGSSGIAMAWLVVLNLLQTGLLVLVGTSAVRRAIQNDFTSGMMDSHRLTPVSGTSAMFGYLVGPNAGALMLLGLNALIGLPLCSAAHYPHREWLAGIFVLLVFVAMLWSLAEVAAIVTRGWANVAMFVAIGTFLGGWILIALVPGAGMLVFGVVTVIFSLLPGGGSVLSMSFTAIAVCCGAQLVIAATFFRAAARKYRRPDRRAFSVPLAFALLIEAAAAGGLGIALWDARPTALRDLPVPGPGPQSAATLVALALLAMLPISAMVHASATWELRRRLEPDRAKSRPLSPLLGIVLATLLMVGLVGILAGLQPPTDSRWLHWYVGSVATVQRQWGLSLVTLIAGLIPPALLLWPVYLRKASGAWLVVICFAVLWVGPPLLDLIFNVALAPDDKAGLTWLTGFSPAGMLGIVWGAPGMTVIPGLLFQVATLLGLGVIVLSRRGRHKTAKAEGRPRSPGSGGPPPGTVSPG